MPKIKLIAFDFGGVYYTYNHSKLISDVAKEVKESPDNVQKAWSVKIIDFELGLCTEDEFWEAFIKSLGKKGSIKKLHSMVINHFQLIPGAKELIEKLKKNYKLALISNQTDWLDELDAKYNFYPQFDYLVISKNEKLRKPEKGIYKKLIEKGGFKPEEVILIDDTLKYRKSVRDAGINFVHFKNVPQLKKELAKLSIKF